MYTNRIYTNRIYTNRMYQYFHKIYINIFIKYYIYSIYLHTMFDNLCTPAQIYLIVSFILMVLSYFGLNAISQQITLNQSNNSFLQSLNFTYQKDTRTSYLIQAVFIVLWTWVLSYLCRKGFSSLSWFLVLLPWVLMFLAFFVYIIETIKKIFFDTTGSLASALDLP